MALECLLYLSVIVLFHCAELSNGVPPGDEFEDEEDIGEPLLLTPFLEKGRLEKARSSAEVKPFVGKIKSYSGYLTVNPAHKSNMFFWYFVSENNPSRAPVVLWLQGGPGTSSLLGLFVEHGPYFIEEGRVKLKTTYWSQEFHVIYVDNPVGTGFSFTRDEGICKNQSCIGENLYSFVSQFFRMFPELRNNDFYIAGQSYGCKFTAALGYFIHKKNPTEKEKIRFKGFAIGNGLCDPVNMMDHGSHLYQLGLIDENAKAHFDLVKKEVSELIRKEQWGDAFDAAFQLMAPDPAIRCFFQNVTGFVNCYNFLKSDVDTSDNDWKRFVSEVSTRISLHVGNQRLQHHSRVYAALKEDFMQSVSPWISELLDDYKVLIYSGQLDLILPYTTTVSFVKNLKWSGSEEYKVAKRKIWMDFTGLIAGYIKKVTPGLASGSLTEVLVRNAGHLVPHDQPAWALEMLHSFIFNLYPF